MEEIKHLLNHKLFKIGEEPITVEKIIAILAILVIAQIAIKLLNKVVSRVISRKQIDKGKGNSIFQIIKYLLWVVAITMALETSGIKITFLLAGSAALLVGIGLGLQQIFQDVVSGIVILFEGTLKVDDVVQMEDGMVGKVKQTGLRVSYIETRDNIIILVPNSRFVNGIVINWSHMEKLTRFNVEVGVAYGSDVRKVEQLLLQCAKEHKSISSIQSPFVMFDNFGESSLDFKLFFWTHEAFWVEKIKSNLRFRINELFQENGVQIPFPQRDVHLKKT